jgi:hypothetical protein
MADEIRVSRPMQQPRGPEYNQGPSQDDRGPMMPSSPSRMPWIILAVIVVILAVCGIVFRDKLFGKSGGQSAGQAGGASQYQAVFLTNGQVYFGKLKDPDSDYVTLNDIYYLQVGPQQGSSQPGQPAPQQSISLVKLGNELHGPVDEMHISRSQVLFYEDLKSDGQVAKAILQDKATRK